MISREDSKIVLTAGPGCKINNHDLVEISVVADSTTSGEPKRASGPF